MNRKLHNSVTALVATTGLLVLSLMAANPISKLQLGADDTVAAPVAQSPAPAQVAVQARHAAEAAKRIEARAAELEARLSQTKDNGKAIGEVVGFVAEAATIATIAAAMDGAMEGADSADAAVEPVAPTRKRAHGRQSVAMPFFSFAPRG